MGSDTQGALGGSRHALSQCWDNDSVVLLHEQGLEDKSTEVSSNTTHLNARMPSPLSHPHARTFFLNATVSSVMADSAA